MNAPGNTRRQTTSLSLALLLALAAGTSGASAQMSAERQGTQVVVSTSEFQMVFDEAAGGDVVDFFNFTEDDTAPYTDKVSQSTTAGRAGLFHIGGRAGASFPGQFAEDQRGVSTLHVLEVSDVRVRLLNELELPNGIHVERAFTVYPSGKLYIDMTVSHEDTIWDFWDKPGGNGSLYDLSFASKEERVAIISDEGAGSDILGIWYENYGVGGTAPWEEGSWLTSLEHVSGNVTTAGFGSERSAANITGGRYTSQQLVEFLRTDVTPNTDSWRRYADDYRNPALPLFSFGDAWDEDGDGYNENEGVYTLAFPIDQQLAFTFDAQGYERIRPSFKARGFRGLELVALEILKDGAPLTLGVDYFAGVVPFTSGWLVDGAAPTQVAAGGLAGDAAESLADSADELSLSTFGAGDALYLGSESPFYGINVDLAAKGSGALVDWEYWNGAAWASLALDELTAGARDLAASGTLLFDATRVPGWAPRALTSAEEGVDTPRSLYWIRARPSADFASAPVVREMRTDLLVLHFMDDVGESAEVALAGDTCSSTPSAVEGLMVAKSGAQLVLSWSGVSDVCFDRYRVYASTTGDWAAAIDLDGDETDATSLLNDNGAQIERFLVTTVDTKGAEGPLRP